MNFTSLFFVRARNCRDYPSFVSRSIFAIISGLAVLNFDYISNGKSVTVEHYWLSKILICLVAVVVVEYIYQIHQWLSFRYGRDGRNWLVAVHQFLLGVVFIRVLIWLVLSKWLGISYLSYIESLGDEKGRSVAMIVEFLMIPNLVFFAFYLYLPQLAYAQMRKNTKTILVFQFGFVRKVETKDVMAISSAKGVNMLLTSSGSTFTVVSRASLFDLYSTLPPNLFELRPTGIYKNGTTQEVERAFLRFVNKS